MDTFTVLTALVAPADQRQGVVFFFFWIAAYTAVYLTWDIISDQTPPFHLSQLAGKTYVIWNAATFANSVLLIVSVFSQSARALVDAAMVPIIMVALAGLMISVSALCPYPPKRLCAIDP